MKARVLILALILSGCATYTPENLEIAASSAIDIPAIEQKANTISRPWLGQVSVDLSAPLTPDGVAAMAVVNNPDLAAQRVRAGVSDAQVFAAGLLPDPTFSAGVSKVLSGPDTVLDISGALGLDIAALRTRAVRREQAVAQQRQVRLDLAWAEWQTAGQARLQAVRIKHLQRVVTLAAASRNAARDLLDQITAAAGRGDIAGDRLQAAELAAFTAEETLRTAETDLAAAQVEITRLLGVPPDYPLRLADVALPVLPPPAEALFALAEANRTDLAALREGYHSQEAAVHQAVLEQFPNLALTLNAQRDTGGNLLAGPAVDFTLPLWNRNRGAIAVERATREALRAEYDARLFQARADIAAAEAGIAVALRRREAALADMPELERYAAATRRAATRGDLSRETAQNAEQAARDRQIQLAQAEQDYAEQMIALELLTGTPRGAWP